MSVAWTRTVASLFRRGRFEHDLDAEVRFHLEMEAQRLVGEGFTEEQARRMALARFGGVERVKEECREEGRARSLEALWQDARHGVRSLLRYPAYSVACLLTLALGIGANTAIFTVVYGVLLRPLPFEAGDRLIRLSHLTRLADGGDARFSALEIADLRAQANSVDGVVEYHSMPFTLLGGEEALRVQTGVVSAEWFDVLGVRPLAGRTFLRGEDAHGADPVLVVSYEFWQNQLGGDPKIVGRRFEMNDRVHTVVGVLPPIPQYPDTNDVYMPVSSCPFRSSERARSTRTLRGYVALARVKPETPLAQVTADLQTVGQRWHAAHPQDYPEQIGFTIDTTTVREELTRRARPTFLLLVGTAGFVLLIACASVANLSLARLVLRQRELALRAVLGAGRGRLLQLVLAESTLLAVGGGLLGLGVAASSVRMLKTFAARFTPRAGEIAIDGWVLVFALAVSGLTGLVFGALGALTRRDVTMALRDGGERSSGGTGGRQTRQALIVVQIAVSFVLLVGAGLMVRSVRELQNVDGGFNPDNVLTARLDLDWSRYNRPEKTRAFSEALLERLRERPGVVSAATADTFPLNAATPVSQGFRIAGRAVSDRDPGPRTDVRVVATEYFQTIGMYLVRGRLFTPADNDEHSSVALINQSLARRYWPNEDPLGQRVSVDEGETWLTIVGLVGDVRQYGLDTAAAGELYLPWGVFPFRDMRVVVRTRTDPMRLATDLRAIVRGLDPAQPISEVQTLRALRSEWLASPRLTASLLVLFALVALAITATGLAGIVAFSVSQRTQEIGVRLAIGADRSRVLRMVLGQGLALAAAGLAMGAVGALLLGRLMASLLYGVAASDPLTFSAVTLLLVAVALAASFAPARRAATVDPVVALRSS